MLKADYHMDAMSPHTQGSDGFAGEVATHEPVRFPAERVADRPRRRRAGRGRGSPRPRTACFYARRALELAVAWAYKHDGALELPYQDNLSALIHEPSFKQTAGEALFSKARVINTLGNRAVHGHRAIPPDDALVASGLPGTFRGGSDKRCSVSNSS